MTLQQSQSYELYVQPDLLVASDYTLAMSTITQV